MLKCLEVTRLCSEELERGLSTRERVAVEMHLLICKGCRNFRQQMAFLRRAMRGFADGRAVSGPKDSE